MSMKRARRGRLECAPIMTSQIGRQRVDIKTLDQGRLEGRMAVQVRGREEKEMKVDKGLEGLVGRLEKSRW